MDRHRLQGDKENSRKEVLRRPDLHPPRCAELNANRMFCAIAALASNAGIGLKVPYLPDRCEPWPLERQLRQVLLLPAARVRQARVQVPAVWLSGWHAGMSRRCRSRRRVDPRGGGGSGGGRPTHWRSGSSGPVSGCEGSVVMCGQSLPGQSSHLGLWPDPPSNRALWARWRDELGPLGAPLRDGLRWAAFPHQHQKPRRTPPPRIREFAELRTFEVAERGRHCNLIGLWTVREPKMNAELCKRALEKVGDPYILVNIVSRRVRQLLSGSGGLSRPLVPNAENLGAADVALLEIAEGKLGWELPEPEESSPVEKPRKRVRRT